MPAPTVLFVSRSMTMNAPVAALALYASYASGWLRLSTTCPTSFIASCVAGRRSSVLTSTPNRTSAISPATVRVVCLTQ